MKKITAVLMVMTVLAPTILLAYEVKVNAAPSLFPETRWVSKNSSDPVTIQNSSGTPLMVEIVVDGVGNSNVPGIIVKNCGDTTHIKAGGSGMCVSNDANNPVSFTSDNSTIAASGTYQIKQK